MPAPLQDFLVLALVLLMWLLVSLAAMHALRRLISRARAEMDRDPAIEPPPGDDGASRPGRPSTHLLPQSDGPPGDHRRAA